MKIIHFCYLLLIFTRYLHGIGAKADVAMEIVSKGLGIANSIKTLYQDPPKIDINNYLSDQEKDYRNKLILEDFLKYYTLENKDFKSIDFSVKGKKKFLFWETNPGDSSEINRLKDMLDKLKQIFSVYGISYPGKDYPTNGGNGKAIDGFVKAIEDCLNNIALKRSIYSFSVMENIFYRDNMDIVMDFESEELISQKDISRYQELEEIFEKSILNLESLQTFDVKASSLSYIKLINALIDLVAYTDYKNDFFIFENMRSLSNSNEIDNAYRLLIELIENRDDIYNDAKNRTYKFLFGDRNFKDSNIQRVVIDIEWNAFQIFGVK